MPLQLKPKSVPKETKVSLPEELAAAFDSYAKASMTASKYPERDMQDAKDQIATVALAKLIAADKDFAAIDKEASDAAKKYLTLNK